MKFLIKDQEPVNLKKGSSVYEIIKKQNNWEEIYAVTIDGKLHDCNYCPTKGGELSFVYADTEVGRMIYERTLSFVFIAAVKNLYPDALVQMEHALSSGQFCEVRYQSQFTAADASRIKEQMDEIIKRQELIERTIMNTEDAIAYFNQLQMVHKAELLKCRKSKRSSVYHLCGCDDYFYGILLPHAGYITHFALRPYAHGIWLSPQNGFQDQKNLFQVFQEFEQWGRAIGVSNVAQLNQKITQGYMDELVLMCETLMETQLAHLAKEIAQKPDTRFILISGPSSAGKTTFSKRLSIHLKILELDPLAISMDNFYRNRADTPRLPDGSYDFESVEAIDLELFHNTMLSMLQQLPVHLPRFNFKTGIQEQEEQLTTLKEKQILIIEGIHGLNPSISETLPKDAVFKIYINALTHLNLDEHNRIPTSDYRLIRRITRDHQSRGWSAADTISFWKNVRNGEDKYIYPYQESADAIFNTSMVYELAVLKKLAIPLLHGVKKDSPQYLEANRLKKLLAYFVDGASDAIPRYSILSEFVGNSILDVY